MLMHLRVIAPPDLVDEVSAFLLGHPSTTAVVSHEATAGDPYGHLVVCDIAREGLNEVLSHLEAVGVSERGAITLLEPAGTPYAAARDIDARIPGDPGDVVIWESVLANARSGSKITLSYLTFLVLAVVLAAIAVLTDSAVLVVGAMVVGPEFAAVASLCLGVVFLRWGIAWRAAVKLIGSFVFAILVVAILAVLSYAGGLIEPGMLTRPRPQTEFIWHPDIWSFVVALVAGAAGVLALTLSQHNAMVGVFISVTTVPAAGNFALGLAMLDAGEMLGSLTQLGINLAGMLASGIAFLLVQRLLWERLAQVVERVFNPGPSQAN